MAYYKAVKVTNDIRHSVIADEEFSEVYNTTEYTTPKLGRSFVFTDLDEAIFFAEAFSHHTLTEIWTCKVGIAFSAPACPYSWDQEVWTRFWNKEPLTPRQLVSPGDSVRLATKVKLIERIWISGKGFTKTL